MKRYEPRPEEDGWAVFDSLTEETLNVPQGDDAQDDAEAYSSLLNDLESIGREPLAARSGA